MNHVLQLLALEVAQKREKNWQKGWQWNYANIIYAQLVEWLQGQTAQRIDGAISAGGKTIAVWGTGLSKIYPEENTELAKQIVESGGLIITEYAPDVEANTYNFPRRNRIVSGLSVGVLVVEAHHRSGTTITAGIAKEQGKKVFAVPNSIDNSYGIITNELIKKGAILTRNVEDIVCEYGFKKEVKKRKNDCNIIEKKIPEEYKEIYNVLSDNKMQIEEIAKKLDEPINSINATLTMMEIENYVKRLPGKFYIRS